MILPIPSRWKGKSSTYCVRRGAGKARVCYLDTNPESPAVPGDGIVIRVRLTPTVGGDVKNHGINSITPSFAPIGHELVKSEVMRRAT